MNMKRYLKNKNQLKYQKFLVQLIIQKSIRKYISTTEENVRQKFRKKNIDKRRNYLSEKINQNDLMRRKNKNVYTVLDYIEY